MGQVARGVNLGGGVPRRMLGTFRGWFVRRGIGTVNICGVVRVTVGGSRDGGFSRFH